MAFKPKTKEFTSEAGNKYTLQSVLPSVWARTVDRITDKHGKLLNQHAMPAMLENVVAAPAGLKMDDFESWSELEEVTTAAFRFQQHGK
jgi:hypothetical protein